MPKKYDVIDEISKSDVHIPESLDKWFLSHGWFHDYWKEIPINWRDWPDSEMNKYPIMQEILNWKKIMPKKYEVLDELIKDELREFICWLAHEKKIELCKKARNYVRDDIVDEQLGFLEEWYPVHKAPEDLINEYMEAK